MVAIINNNVCTRPGRSRPPQEEIRPIYISATVALGNQSLVEDSQISQDKPKLHLGKIGLLSLVHCSDTYIKAGNGSPHEYRLHFIIHANRFED